MTKRKFIISLFCCAASCCLVFTVNAQKLEYLNTQTVTFYRAGKMDSAIFYAGKATELAEAEYGKTNNSYAISLTNLGFLYRIAGDYPKAEPCLVEALEIKRTLFGPDHPDYVSALNNLGFLYKDISDFQKAKLLFEEALIIRKKNLGPDHPDYVASVINLANLYESMEDTKNAERLFGEALAIRERVLGKEHPDYAASLNSLARLYLYDGNYARAKPMLIEALAIRRKALGSDHPDYVVSLSMLGFFYQNIGDYLKAEPLYQEALSIREKTAGTNSPDYALSLNYLATLYHDMGDYSKAEPLYIKALAIRKKALGPDNTNYAASLNNLAGFYQDMGDYVRAESLYVDALAIIKKAWARDNAVYALSLNNLGIFYQDTRQYSKAEPILLEALTIRKKILGLDHPAYASSLENLGSLYNYMGDHLKAEPLLAEALSITKRVLGQNHPDYALSLNNLAYLYYNMGIYAKAEPLFLEALDIVKASLGKDHPDYAKSLNSLAVLYEDRGDYAKAESLIIQVKKIELHNIGNDFSFLSESEKEKYLSTFSFIFKVYQSFFLNYYAAKPAVSAEAYDIELATKGMILSSGIQLRQAIRGSGNKEAIDLFNHWVNVKNILAKLYSFPIAKRQLNTDSIENLANIDEKELTRLSASFRQGKLLTEANWKSVQQALKPREVAIEFASFKYYNKKRWTDTTFYTALVLRKDDPYPTMVNLCRQDQLDSLLNNAGNTRSTFISSLYRGATIRSTDTSAVTRKKLYKLVWKPIDKLLHPGDHIFYAPSGLLHQVAFAAIPAEDGALLSDSYQLTQLSSTAMLLQPVPAIDVKRSSIAAYGGIQYDAPETELARLASKDTERFVSRSLLPDSIRGGASFDYLPGTLTEINSIDSLAKRYQIPVTLYTGINATEASYKRFGLGASPQIIHIATHGFFFPDPQKSRRNNAGVLSAEKSQFQLSDNPLNRAGLLFAGGDHAWKGENIPPGLEDGILTAYEASNVPLSGTALVVLSACETGLGDIKGAEGVFGLQRAFKAAGATYLMMSLWQVPDNETAEFMKYFYEDLFSGQSIENAFTSAQTTMKNKYRSEPYKWAAFVLMR